MSKSPQLWVVWKRGDESHTWTVDAMSRMDAKEHYAEKYNISLLLLVAMTVDTYDKRQEKRSKR